MPKSKRVEYPGAFYHVLNRGRNRENIFHNESDFQLFLEIIEKSYIKFGFIIHAYCLMDNHYHLLLETPYGNLNKIMHDISSLYVQRYNRSKGCDGSLFKGRYKAILVEKDSYLLELNRYIHRNSLSITEKLEDYKWSSYRSYVGLSKAPIWLNQNQTLQILGVEKTLEKFTDFVTCDRQQDQELYRYRKVLPSILGSVGFRNQILKK